MRLPRTAPLPLYPSAAAVGIGLLVALVGCSGPKVAKNPPPHYLAPHVTDRAAPPQGYPAVERDAATALTAVAAAVPAPPVPPRRLNVLAISGGGQYGAFAGGLLVGWTCRGDRPAFDVCTGISSGALLATLAFAGPKYDPAVQRLTTTLKTEDVFRYKPILYHVARTQSLASAAPLRQRIDETVTDEMLADIRDAHCAGRRLFIGTMNLHTRRLVVWDLGAIATSGRPDAGDMVRKLLLASCSIPGLAPAIPVEVDVDGCRVTELHGDGGGVAQTFVRFGPDMPRVDPANPAAKWLAGSNLYAIAGGKLYLEVLDGKLGFLSRTTGTVSATLYALFRADLWRLFTLCSVSGMRFQTCALPAELEVEGRSTTFDPPTELRMFTAGYDFQMKRTPWRGTPPGVVPGEEDFPRAGTAFTVP